MIHRKKKNWIEWCVFTFGLVLVTGMASYLAYDLVTAPSGPPRVSAHLGEISEHSGRYQIHVDVRNDGHEVAEGVEIEVELQANETARPEKAGFTIQFLPRGAKRSGTVSFTSDPRQAHRLTARVLGYRKP